MRFIVATAVMAAQFGALYWAGGLLSQAKEVAAGLAAAVASLAIIGLWEAIAFGKREVVYVALAYGACLLIILLSAAGWPVVTAYGIPFALAVACGLAIRQHRRQHT